jgi:signal transduction histidine kinase
MHELRGAANSVALHLQLLTMESRPDDDDPERRQRSLAAVDDGRRRLFDIAEVFVRHAVVPDAKPTEFDLARVTGDAVALSRPYAVARRVEMNLAPTGLAPAVCGRRDVVSQVMLDLLLDMLDRTPNGGSVDVRVESENGAGVVLAALRASSPETTPDAERVARAASAIKWAGGELRHDGNGVVLRLPVPPPGESP